jgi:NADPH:quinone reductase-like Zn-dependent oxidoreductase
MKTVSLTAFGDSRNFTDLDRPLPAIGARDVLIRTKAVGFNPIDYQVRTSGFENLVAPIVLGFEVAGIVERVGSGVSSVAVGDRVTAWLGGPSLAGGYAEFAAAPEDFVVRMPANLSFAEAAGVPLGSLTALRCLQRAGLTPEKSLLVAGGSGGVGSWAILLAAALGHRGVVTTAGSDGSVQYIEAQLGVPQARILRYKGLPRAALAAEATRLNNGARFDITLDCVGDSMTRLCCDAVDFGGTAVSIVNGPRVSDDADFPADEDVLFNKSAAFHFELIFAQTEYAPARATASYARDMRKIAALLEAGALRLPKITEVGTLSAETVRAAHQTLEGGHTMGKLVATVA